jgi:hypothetical protein
LGRCSQPPRTLHTRNAVRNDARVFPLADAAPTPLVDWFAWGIVAGFRLGERAQEAYKSDITSYQLNIRHEARAICMSDVRFKSADRAQYSAEETSCSLSAMLRILVKSYDTHTPLTVYMSETSDKSTTFIAAPDIKELCAESPLTFIKSTLSGQTDRPEAVSSLTASASLCHYPLDENLHYTDRIFCCGGASTPPWFTSELRRSLPIAITHYSTRPTLRLISFKDDALWLTSIRVYCDPCRPPKHTIERGRRYASSP